MANEKRLICANALKSEFEWLKSVSNETSKDEIQEIIQRIDNAPTVDAVEVVHCKDCVHMKEQFNARYCEIWCMFNGMGDEGFCNYGERKDGDQS